MDINIKLINRFIVPDKELITAEEAERNCNIKTNKLLFAGKQTDVFLSDYLNRIELGGSKLQGQDGYIPFQSDTAKNFFRSVLQGVNNTKPIVKTYAGLLFGQGFSVTSNVPEQQEWLNGKKDGQESFEKYLCKKLYSSAIEAGLTGNGVIEIYEEIEADGNKKAKIAVIPADRWYPIVSEKDESEIVANAIIHCCKW